MGELVPNLAPPSNTDASSAEPEPTVPPAGWLPGYRYSAPPAGTFRVERLRPVPEGE